MVLSETLFDADVDDTPPPRHEDADPVEARGVLDADFGLAEESRAAWADSEPKATAKLAAADTRLAAHR